ncbi:phosphate ABC transporter permease subunit PstC, partial [Vibrio breoganii]
MTIATNSEQLMNSEATQLKRSLRQKKRVDWKERI